MSRSESIQTDVHHYEPDRRATSVRPPPPIPKKPDQRGKNNLVKQSCDFSPTYEAYEEILASSEPVRTGPSDSDQHLYEEISELQGGLQDGSGVCAAKGKGFSSSSLMESDGDFQVKSGLLPEKLGTLTLQTDKDKTSSFKHLQKTANPSTPPVPAIRLKKCVPGSWELMGMNKSPQGGERHPLASGPHNSSQNYYNEHGTVSELRIQRNVLLMAAVPDHLAGGFQDTHSQDRESSWKGNILNRTGGSDSDSRDFEKTLKHYVSHLPFCATALQRQTAELREVADALDKTHKGTRIARITGGTTGAVGGVAAVAGILLAPATLGASLAVTAIGVGVATAGGITGASAAITKKVKKNQVRKKVESILKEYQCEMSDIEVYLNNISVEMGKLKGVTARTARLVEVARGTPDALGAMNRSSGVIQGFALGMDLFFSDKDSQKLKKGSKTRFAQKIREVADQIQASLTELMDMREKLISEGI